MWFLPMGRLRKLVWEIAGGLGRRCRGEEVTLEFSWSSGFLHCQPTGAEAACSANNLDLHGHPSGIAFPTHQPGCTGPVLITE